MTEPVTALNLSTHGNDSRISCNITSNYLIVLYSNILIKRKIFKILVPVHVASWPDFYSVIY